MKTGSLSCPDLQADRSNGAGRREGEEQGMEERNRRRGRSEAEIHGNEGGERREAEVRRDERGRQREGKTGILRKI